MTQRRMTTLISMAPMVPVSLKKNLEKAETEIRKFLRSRGLQPTAADFAALIEELSPATSRKFLNYALDFVRPFAQGMGLRVVRLSDTQVEMVLPYRKRNSDRPGTLHDGAILAASVEAVRCLWNRHTPLGKLDMSFQGIQFKKHRHFLGTCRIRMELTEGIREKVLAELRSQKRRAICESDLSIFDEKDQKVGEVTVQTELQWTPALNSTKD